MVKVLRADKSPLNKKQWLCELECGHEQWVTSTRKPTKARCYECDFPTVKDAEQSVQADGLCPECLGADDKHTSRCSRWRG